VADSELTAHTSIPQGLTVTINSFSYKKGIPQDTSGNGGGYVFDCRALPNPGRYAEYRCYTGKDRPVIEFLQGDEAVENFLAGAQQLVGPSIKKYLERKFTSLTVSFGCTGGQHRSVYCAERLGEWIKNNFDCQVIINHREQ
jgi:RNase adaptor protein for sRNA GlmZ degradation